MYDRYFVLTYVCPREKTYRVLPKYSTQDSVRSISSTGSDHVRRIDVLHIRCYSNIFKMVFYLQCEISQDT